MKKPASIVLTLRMLPILVGCFFLEACQPKVTPPQDHGEFPVDSMRCKASWLATKTHLDSATALKDRGAHPDSLLLHLDAAIKHLEDCPDYEMETRAYFFVGNVQRKYFGRNALALRNQKKAASAALGTPQRFQDSLLAQITNEVSMLYMMLGQQDSGVYYVSKALEAKQRLYGPKDRRTATSLTNLSQAYINLQDYAKADSIRALVVQIRRSQPSDPKHNNHGNAYSNRAESRMYLGDLKGSDRYLQLAYAAYSLLPDQARNLASTLDTETQLAIRLGDLPRAADCMGRALALAAVPYPSPHRELGKLQLTAAEVQRMIGQPDSALALYHAALLNFCPLYRDTARVRLPATWQFGREPYTFSALAGKAHAWEALGRPGNAASSYRSAFTFSDHLRRNFSTIEEQRFLMRMNFPEFERAIRMSFRAGRNAEVFEWIERSKANDLLDALTQLGAAHPELLPEEAMQHGRALGDSLVQAHANQDKGLPGADAAIQRWQDSLAAFTATVQRTHPGLLPSQHTFMQIKELQKENVLPDSALFISYFVGDSNLYISAFNGWRDTCVIVEDILPLQQAIDNLLKALQSGTETSTRDAYARDAHLIYQTLVAPVLPIHASVRQSTRRLLVAPDGQLSFIPFAALLDQAASPEQEWGQLPYMLRRWNISYINSGTHLARLKEMGLLHKKGVLPGIFGIGTDGSPNDPLPYAALEVSQAVEIMGGTELLKEAALEAALKRPRQHRDILHLSSHGSVNDSAPLLSHIQLGGDSTEDGLLHLYEIFGLELNERLAVLNACQTGIGQSVRGQGVISMGYAFQVANCPTTVMSLWNIDDDATSKVFRNFYRQLAQGERASGALRNATLAYLSNDDGPDYHHPRYWAPFVMVGDGEQVFVASPRPSWAWLLLFAPLPLTLLLILFWRHRRRAAESANALDEVA